MTFFFSVCTIRVVFSTMATSIVILPMSSLNISQLLLLRGGCCNLRKNVTRNEINTYFNKMIQLSDIPFN